MDASWKKNIRNNNELNNKKFWMNNSPNKNNMFNGDYLKNKKDIYSKKKGNSFIDKNDDNYQSYQILYVNNPFNLNNTRGKKPFNNKIAHNNYYTNTVHLNKKEKDSSINTKYKNNVKLMNGLNKKPPSVHIDNNKNYLGSKNKGKNIIYETFSNINNNKRNNFKTSDTNLFISSQNAGKKNLIYSNNEEEEINLNIINKNENFHENQNIINPNNKIKNKSNYHIPKKIPNSKNITSSYSHQNMLTYNPKFLVKTEENYDNNKSGYINNINNISNLNRNDYDFYISSPLKYNNLSNNINLNNKKIFITNKSAKKEKVKYPYNNISDISDYNYNNNYSNINIDLFENNTSKNSNNYINVYFNNNNINNNSINNNNNKLLYYQNNQKISKNNIKGNYYCVLPENNPPKITEYNEEIKNIKVNTSNAKTRNHLLTERNKKDTKKKENKSLENSDCHINIKIKNNTNFINKIINKTNDNSNFYNDNRYNNINIYKKKIESKNNKLLIHQKESNNNINVIINKSQYEERNKNINKKKSKLKSQKSNLSVKRNIILEKPKNKNNFKKKLYCYNIKIYEIKRCYFNKTYISKNITNKNNKKNTEEKHEITFTEKISVYIDSNNMNTLSLNNDTNIIGDPSLIENSFNNNSNNNNKIPKETNHLNIIQSYKNSKNNQKNFSSIAAPVPNKNKNLIKSKKNKEKIGKNIDYINNIEKEELEMTFGIEEIKEKNKNKNKKENSYEEEEEKDLYQNEDIKIMTDDEEAQDNLRITQGKEIINTKINPDKINKGLELLEKIQKKRNSNKLGLNFINTSIDKNENDNNSINDNKELEEYYKKTNTLKQKDIKVVINNLTKNKKCEILNNVLTDLFEKKEKEAKIFNNEILNYNPIKIEKYENIFKQMEIQNLESILTKRQLYQKFDFIYDKEELMEEMKTKKSEMTYNKKLYKSITNELLENSLIKNKIIFSYKNILELNKKNILCKKENLLPKEVINHCNDLLYNFEKDNKKVDININNINNENDKWNRKDMSIEIKKAEEYVKNMNKAMSKNNYKFEIIGILNTLTVDNYSDILIQLNNIIYQVNNNNKIKKINQEILLDNQFQFSEIIIEKAIMEKGYVKLYAKICHDLFLTFNQIVNESNNNILITGENLQSLLISECKQKLNEYQYNKDNLNINNNDDIFLIKKKFLGNINFICELIDSKLFSQKIGFNFLDILYKNYENFEGKNKNLNLEGIITLLNKLGKIVFQEKNEKYLQDLEFFMKENLIPLINDNKSNNNKNIPEYLKYKIINLIEKQKNNWEESLFEKSITAKGKNSL